MKSSLGRFEGDVLTTWLLEADLPDTEMRLEDSFAYIDAANKRWSAAKGRRVDGASIPPIFWGSIVGSPYTGDFRRATVVHDIACQDKNEPSDDVHRMFYFAMLCDGTAQWLANAMYAAVKLFGPDWDSKEDPIRLTNWSVKRFQRLVQDQNFVQDDNIASIDRRLNMLKQELRKGAP